MKKLWMVVPVYNGKDDIPDFCATLKNSTQEDAYSLVAVDDCSTDSSSDLIPQNFPQAVLIRNERNEGFAGACNKGMRYALDHGADYVMLANQDLRFMDGWMKPLLELLEKDATIGAVQPKILMYPDTSLINSCGNALHILGFGYTMGYLKKADQWPCVDVADVAYCSGAAVVYRAEVLRNIGLFDESFFMYHEDTDLCWRLSIAGYRNVVCPQSQLAHRYEFSRSITKFYYIERNRLLIMLKNYQYRTLVCIFPLFLFWECGMIGYSFLQLFTKQKSVGIKEKLRGYMYFLFPSVWKHIVHERKLIAKLRRRSDRNIMALFTDEIAFQDIDNSVIQKIANPITRWYWKLIKHCI